MTTGKVLDGKPYTANGHPLALKFPRWAYCLIVALSALAAECKTVDIKAGMAGHWHEAASYEGGELPASNDTVRVYCLHATANDADCQFLSEKHVAKLTLEGDRNDPSRTSLTITISGEVAELACEFNVENSYTDELVKEGPGRLVIGEIRSGSAGPFPKYTVNNGILQLPVCESYQLRNVGRVTVNHPGVLWPMTPANSGLTSPPNNYFMGLFGDGVVSNPVEWATNVRIENASSEKSSFSGSLGGNIVFSVKDRSTGFLTGTSCITNTVSLPGAAALHLGAVGSDDSGNLVFGSAGPGRFAVGANATLGYLGESEVSHARIENSINKDIARSLTLDGGPNGGLELAGSIDLSNTTNATVNLILAGTNRSDCILSGLVKGSSSATRAMRIVKRGSGSWQVKENASSTVNGVIAVEEGTLKADSLAQTGKNCAIGKATLLMEDYGGAYDAGRLIPYALLLGAEGTRGTLTYSGTGAATVTSRLIGLLGDGGLESGSAPIFWNGVTAAVGGSHTLVLGGDAEGSVLNDVSNGVGQVSITKEGLGDWTLGGTLDFTGAIDVKAGRLAISSAVRPYSWFKVLFTEAHDGGRNLQLCRFGLFDSEGTMQCANLSSNDVAFSYVSLLNPGEATFCCMAENGYRIEDLQYGSCLTNLFVPESGANAMLHVKTTKAADPNNDTTWFGFVLRLPNGADTIASYDLGTRWADDSSYVGRTPQSWKVYGSEDGFIWKELSSVVSNRTWNGACYWMKGGTQYFKGDNVKNPDGWPISGGIHPESTLAGGIDGLAVAAGAVLTADTTVTTRRVTVDFAGMGTVSGFALAEGGIIDVVNAPARGGFEVSADFSGIALPANYSFFLNGASPGSRRVKFSGDGRHIVCVPKGIVVDFR